MVLLGLGKLGGLGGEEMSEEDMGRGWFISSLNFTWASPNHQSSQLYWLQAHSTAVREIYVGQVELELVNH